MGEPEGKGAGFSGAVATLRRMVPAADLERVLATLPEETADVVRHPPLPVAWIPTRHFVALLQVAERELFRGDEEKLAEWGREAIKNDLRTIYKMFIRFLSPQYVIERGARLWRTYTRNSGEVSAFAVDEHTCEVNYSDMPELLRWPGYWAYQRGALRGVMEATGLKMLSIELLEGGGTASHARFRVRW